MKTRFQTLEHVRHEVRRDICATCKSRTQLDAKTVITPRACEGGCPVFRNLALLKAVGERVDPMVGSHAGVIDSAVDYLIDREAPTSTLAGQTRNQRVLQAHRTKLANLLRRLLNPY